MVISSLFSVVEVVEDFFSRHRNRRRRRLHQVRRRHLRRQQLPEEGRPRGAGECQVREDAHSRERGDP